MKDRGESKEKDAFQNAAASVSANGKLLVQHASDAEQLKLYGLYKRITVGCKPIGDRPSWIQAKARAKYDSWRSCTCLSIESAKEDYIHLSSEILHRMGVDIEEIQPRGDASYDVISMPSSIKSFGDSTGSGSNDSTTMADPASVWLKTKYFSWMNLSSYFPRIVPRGQLDISFRDLMFAVLVFISRIFSVYSNANIRKKYEAKVSDLWQGSGKSALVSLSIRSAFDLYLQARNFPPGSEIIMTSIQIEGMTRIAVEGHKLKIVVLDCLEDTLAPSIDSILKKISDRTVAIMIVHAFGAVGNLNIAELSEAINRKDIDIIEDCAECFSGVSEDSEFFCDFSSDLAFFSFGTIKTCTALGGGITLIKDKSLATKMEQIQVQYAEASNISFLFKVMKTALLLVICRNFYVFGGILYILQSIGANYEAIITGSLRGFSTKDGSFTKQLLQLVRRRISVVNLILLNRRLSKFDPNQITKRIQQCEEVASLLDKYAPNIIVPGKRCQKHTFWLFPVMLKNNPDLVSRNLYFEGYDIPRGTSQLASLDKYGIAEISDCPNAAKLMKSILYLPIASTAMSNYEKEKMVMALSRATNADNDINFTGFAASRRKLNPPVATALFMMISLILSISSHWHIIWGYLILPSCFLFFMLLCVIVWCRERTYCSESSSLIKHLNILKNSKDTTLHDKELNKTNKSDLNQVDESEQKRAFLTGATGFVGSLILRDLLFHKNKLGINGVVLLLRKKRFKSIEHRVDNLLGHAMFNFLSYDEKKKLVSVVEGDITKSDFGLTPSAKIFLNEAQISHAIHCAASVKFNQSFEGAATINISSALVMQRLAKTLGARFIYISTAFVHGNMTGSRDCPMQEDLFPLGKYSAKDIYESMMGTQSLSSMVLNEFGFPNTYTLSKCICEHLLLEDSSSDVVIVRPCIVGPAWRTPWEGWAGQSPSTLVAGACLFLKNPTTVWSFGNTYAPVIPVDIVSKFTLSVGFSTQFEGIGLQEDIDNGKHIFNVTWNVHSSRRSNFTWKSFGYTTIQFGALYGCYSRFFAQLFHYFVSNFLWRGDISFYFFSRVHYFLTKTPFEYMVHIRRSINPNKAEVFKKMSSAIDMPLFFWPFTRSTFFFQSSVKAPCEFDGERYMTSCVLASGKFLHQYDKNLCSMGVDKMIIGGKIYKNSWYDFPWAICQPRGNPVIRLIGWCFVKVLRLICMQVTVDLLSFSDAAKLSSELDSDTYIILAPTHRSILDFVLISYLSFMLPELGIDLPFICAAEEFAKIPVIGFLLHYAQAFFVRRGKGQIDPDVAKQLSKFKRDGNTTFEVFIEGTRSRNRRFLKPKTGILRSLQNTGGQHIIVPITVSYEKIPEQTAFANEHERKDFRLSDFCSWLMDVYKGRISIGRVHIAAGQAIRFGPEAPLDETVRCIQLSQQQRVMVSFYHIKASALVLTLPESLVKEALVDLGCSFWDEDGGCLLETPKDEIELTSVMMQWIHLIAPYFTENFPTWALWMNPQVQPMSERLHKTDSILKVVHAVEKLVAQADRNVKDATTILSSRGFMSPSVRHILQYVESSDFGKNSIFTRAAVDIAQGKGILEQSAMKLSKDLEPIFCPARGSGESCLASEVDKGDENFGSWGYKDSGFIINFDDKGKPAVIMKGGRYNICGRHLKSLVSFLESEMRIKLDLLRPTLPSHLNNPIDIPSSALSSDDLLVLQKTMSGKLSTHSKDRCRHGTGHTVEDMFRIRSGAIREMRFPDAVVWPENESDIIEIIKVASENNWCLIPFGGGTNVTHATWCPSKAQESRPIISLDMKAMNEILWVNREDGVAHIQAGITGRELACQLEQMGFTMGHEPDSFEFSTLGGWIATKASGMKRGKYGNIEDLVRDVRIVDSNGKILGDSYKENNGSSFETYGRVSTGTDLTPIILGSEGCLGIITSAVVRVFPLPEVIEYEGILLHSFDIGISFVQEVSKMGNFKPSSVRLVDNAQFRLGQSLKGEESSFFNRFASHIMKTLIISTLGFMKESTVSVSITFEGSLKEVLYQKQIIRTLSQKYDGFLMGESVGRAGYDLTFAIAYLRDFAMTYGCLGESFETFVHWSRLRELISSTKDRIRVEHRNRCLPGEPLISCRITQLYDEGVCVYFYYLMSYEGIYSPTDIYVKIENAAREEILSQGGSLSHHHGVGKIRGKWIEKIHSKDKRQIFKSIKDGMDPNNLFGARNGSSFLYHGEYEDSEQNSLRVDVDAI